MKHLNCNQISTTMTSVILVESTFTIMSVLILMKSVGHCVRSEQSIQAMSQQHSPRRPAVTSQRPHDLDETGICANEGRVVHMCLCVCLTSES